MSESNLELELKNLEAMRREFTTAAAKATKARDDKGGGQSSSSSSTASATSSSGGSDNGETSCSRILRANRRVAGFRPVVENISLNLVNLPDCALEHLLKYLSYDQVAHLRVVCRRFDQLCSHHLNRGFRGAERFHAKCMKEVKSKLPRRESERRNHPLARHCDILTAIETRISLLAMTFMKFVDVGMCCFIPGKVVDEIFKVLRTIKHDKNPPRAYEVLQELRDISSMAMEYFDEKIVPTLKLSTGSGGSGQSVSPKFQSPVTYLSGLPAILAAASPPTPLRAGGSLALPTSPLNFAERLIANEKRLKTLGKRSKKASADNLKQMSEFNQVLQEQNGKISSLETLIGSQQTVIANQAEKLKDQECRFSELSRKLLEKEQSMKDLLQKFESKFEAADSGSSGVEAAKSKDRGGRKRKGADEAESSTKKVKPF